MRKIGAALVQLNNAQRVCFECAAVTDELIRRGWSINGISPDDVDAVADQLVAADLVCAETPIALYALSLIGSLDRVVDDYCPAILPFLRRGVRTATPQDLEMRDWLRDGPLFVKPVRSKLFTGRVVTAPDVAVEIASRLRGEMLYVSDVVSWKAEFRVYAMRGQILEVCRYQGDAATLPDLKFVSEAIDALVSGGTAPAGYCLDVGVDAEGQTAVIEFNDGFSVINYGLTDALFADLLIARWAELTS